MKLLAGFGHHFFRRESIGPARANFFHPRPDFIVPSGLDFGRGKVLDAGKQFLRKFDPSPGRPFQHLLRERFLCSRHGLIIEQSRSFGKRPDGQAGFTSGKDLKPSPSRRRSSRR
jgi:hypothetical protein